MSYARSTKRQYQPQISTFFNKVGGSPLTPSTRTSLNRSHADNVVLPAQVQSSLLSVGMRVRKAVPEGYQNKDKLSVAAPAVPGPAPSDAFDTMPSLPRKTNTRFELAPFCGIHKIGGFGTQTFYDQDEDAAFASSQESFVSTVSTDSVPEQMKTTGTANTRKRWMRDEEEEQLDTADVDVVLDPAYFDRSLWNAGVFDHNGDMTVTERPMAKAVSRRKAAMSSPVRATEDGDFEEATFLRDGSDEEMAW